MGFYPTAPSSNIYNIGSPTLPAVTMNMSNGAKVKSTTKNWTSENIYIKEMYLNGKLHKKSYLTYDEIKDGADLHYVMSDKPNRRRAVKGDAIPPSLSTPKATLRYKTVK